MAQVKAQGGYHLVFRPFEDRKQVWLKVDTSYKWRAKEMEAHLKKALRTGDYSGLDSDEREACIRLFHNRGLSIPGGLRLNDPPSDEYVLWDKKRGAIQLFFSYPSIKKKTEQTLERYSYCFQHLRRLLGNECVMGSLWAPQIRQYCSDRRDEGASDSTIGWELSTLSKLFGVLIENVRITGIKDNPVRLLDGESRKGKPRNAYLSKEFVESAITVKLERKTNKRGPVIHKVCPDWLRPIILTGWMTGMRRGEILNLRRSQVRLDKRMIYFGNQDQTKEGQPKRIPIHQELVGILEDCLRVASLSTDHLFLLRGRCVSEEAVKSAWRRIMKALNPDPRPTFHDLRHTFKANCARSGIPERISERILGHADSDGNLDGTPKVGHRYGEISDKELLDAIDKLTFDHGDSMIMGRPVTFESVRPTLEEPPKKEKGHAAT